MPLLLPLPAFAEKAQENPGLGKMAADVVFARPLGLVMLGAGTALFVVTLPFSLLGGNVGDAGQKLVIEPGKEVFVRCLGCSTPGRKPKLGN